LRSSKVCAVAAAAASRCPVSTPGGSASLRPLLGAQLQTSALPDRLRVGEALRLFARLAEDTVDWRALAEAWGLSPILPKSFGTLSGGQRQRLFLAIALVNRPRLVFLDELTQDLDPAARRETWELIERARGHGTTVVLASTIWRRPSGSATASWCSTTAGW
jgi:ABC-2 type transport system ATP-binding protein